VTPKPFQVRGFFHARTIFQAQLSVGKGAQMGKKWEKGVEKGEKWSKVGD
jgi:hypothetical protein